jgi:hypothetical protein
MYQQRGGYKVEEKLYLGVREQKRLNTIALDHAATRTVCNSLSNLNIGIPRYSALHLALLRYSALA